MFKYLISMFGLLISFQVFAMDFKKIEWDYINAPKCNKDDIVILVQYGEAEIAKYVTPKPKGVPPGGGDFYLDMREKDDGLEEKVFNYIAKQHPDVIKNKDNPHLFLMPTEYIETSTWE